MVFRIKYIIIFELDRSKMIGYCIIKKKCEKINGEEILKKKKIIIISII